MRRTIYKEFDKESQDMLLQLISKQHIIEMLCFMFWAVPVIFTYIPVFIIEVCEDVEFSMTTQIAIITFMMICFVGFLVSMKVFKRAMFGFSQLLAERIYFLVCTTKGKALKTGSIEFLAVKKFSPHDDEEDDGKDFTMHVLYANNGWAFDTYSSRQYPIEKLHEIYKAKIYKSFSFNEISSKSYKEFREEQEPELAKWSIDNDCSMFWKGDKEET